MDIVSKADRSRMMAQIQGSKNRSTELAFIRILRTESIKGWRRNYPLFGRPDFVFPKSRLAVFIDGCFWHACSQHFSMPSSNHEFWEKKISRNTQRDRVVTRQLKKKGWAVIRFWEHDMTGGRGFTLKIGRLKKIVEKGELQCTRK